MGWLSFTTRNALIMYGVLGFLPDSVLATDQLPLSSLLVHHRTSTMDDTRAHPHYRSADEFSVYPGFSATHPHLAHPYTQTQHSSAAHTFLVYPRTFAPADPVIALPAAQIMEIPEASSRDLCDLFKDLGATPLIGVATSVCSDLSLPLSFSPQNRPLGVSKSSNMSASSEWQRSTRLAPRVSSLGGSMDQIGRFEVLESSATRRDEDMPLGTADMDSHGVGRDRATLSSMPDMELDSNE